MRSTAPRSRTTVVSSPACAFSKLPRKVEDCRYGLPWRRLSGIGSYTSPALLPTRSEVRPPGGMLPDPAFLSRGLRPQVCRSVHKKSSPPVVDQLTERTYPEGNHRSATSQSLHCSQRTGFCDLACNDKAARSRQEFLFADAANCAEKAMTVPQAGTDRIFEIALMAPIAECGARQK